MTSDEGLKSYLTQVLRQLAEWLTKGAVQKLCVVITGVETKEVLERWVFNIDTDKAAMAPGVVRTKSQKDIQGEIQAIIRQVTACVTFLPLLEEPCTFDLLVYTNTDAAVPKAWEESDPKVRMEGVGGLFWVCACGCRCFLGCTRVCMCCAELFSPNSTLTPPPFTHTLLFFTCLHPPSPRVRATSVHCFQCRSTPAIVHHLYTQDCPCCVS